MQGLRWRPVLWDIQCGCILWLPANHRITKHDLGHYTALQSLPARCVDPPVIVVDSILKSPMEAIVCFIPTSSSGRSGMFKAGRNKKSIGAVLPIFMITVRSSGLILVIIRCKLLLLHHQSLQILMKAP